jgi:hypothetical protein
MEDVEMSKDKVNWEPDVRKALDDANNWGKIKRDLEKGPQPQPGVVGNLLKLLGETGEIANNINDSKSDS